MKINVSNFSLGTILLRMEENERLHPITLYSKKISIAQINYKIYENNLLL